tara:strand:+ start:348 stop:1580 length:1233 start_codon:yes stop_codon:yes gene_type:complete
MPKRNINTDEVDLFKIFLRIWNNKSKVIIITGITVIVLFTQNLLNKTYFKASTNIKPISIFDESKYDTFNIFLNQYNRYFDQKTKLDNENIDENTNENSIYFENKINIETINQSYLIDIFLDRIRDGRVAIKIIKDLNLVERSNFKNQQDYENAVLKLASSIKLIPPIEDKNKSLNKFGNWSIEFQTRNIEEWNNFLINFDKHLNKIIQLYLRQIITNLILNEKELTKFKVEDIDQKILNSFNNYKNQIKNRIAFLKEQALIARELDIAKNKLEGQQFVTSGSSAEITMWNAKFPYYMRGYLMIEKEIDLIQNRKDIEPFIVEIETLNEEKNELINDKKIDRLEKLVYQTPIFTEDEFLAAKIDYISTNYSSNKLSNHILILLSTFIGLIFGIIYVLAEGLLRPNRLTNK